MNLRPLLIFVMCLGVSPPSESSGLPASLADPFPGDLNPASEPLAIVVNLSNPVEGLSSSELRTIFLGNRIQWPNGRRITLVMREPGDPERQAILRDVCGLSEQQFRTHFLRGLYNGEILISPKTLSSVNGVRRFVVNVPGAIGYLRLSDMDPSVKKLRIDGLRPEDKGYKLHLAVQENK